MGALINRNLTGLKRAYDEGYSGAVLEGGTRSGKTWSSIDFLLYICSVIGTGYVINIIKETQVSFKTTLYDDFNKRLPDFGLVSPFQDVKEIMSFWLLGSKVNLIGADKPSKFEGAGSDFSYFNEALEITQRTFDEIEQRCRMFWWMDYNPKFTDHWIFDKIVTRQDVFFRKTTFLDNPHISKPEKRKVLSYKPTEENIKNGTADDYMWKVYGLGERMAMQGAIFQNVRYIDKFPDIAYVYGHDFGFTNDPYALVKVAEDGKGIYLELLIYEPCETPDVIDATATALGVNKRTPSTGDSSDKYVSENKGTIEMVRGLRELGWRITKVVKSRSVVFWITQMKKKPIYIVKNRMFQYAKREAENYCWREVNGILINQPIDKFNHFWDAARYGFMSLNTSIKSSWS